MTVQTVINPIDNSEVTIIEGVIQRIIYKEAKPNAYGTTHNASLLIDGDYINFISMKVKEGRQPQLQKVTGTAPNLKWEDINEGDTVKVVVKVSQYQGKPQYTSGTSKINIIKKGEGKPAQQSQSTQSNGTSGATSYKKRDTTGMETGHAVNGALELKRSGVKGEVVDLAKMVHEATVELKSQVASERGVDISDYDTGASVGHAILNACRDASKSAKKESLIEDARAVLVASEEVAKYIKGETVETKKKAPEKEKEQKVEKEKEPESDTPFDSGVDFDEDIPFAPLGLQYPSHAIHVLF